MGKIRMWKKFLFLSSMFLGLLFVWNTDASAERMGRVTLKVGQERQFESQGGYLPSTKKYHWWVSNPGIISVEPDKYNSKYSIVTALAPGTVTLYVKHAASDEVWDGFNLGFHVYEQTDTWTITVEEADEGQGPTDIDLNHVYWEIPAGCKRQLTYTLNPAGAYAAVTFSSSDPTVATVGETSGWIYAKNTGSAKITARTSNGVTETCWVKVTSPQPPKATGIKLDKDSLTVEQGKTKKLTATLSPAGAAGKVTWKSSNPKIASVKNGTVKGLKKGTVTITAKLSSKIYAECKVTVLSKPTSVRLSKKKLSLTAGQKYKLGYTLLPKGAKSKIAWSSSREAVASVNKSGNVTAKKAGTATVNVKTANGKKASCKVTVKALKPKSIRLSAKSMNMDVGTKKKLTYTLSPQKAQSKVTFTSSNPKVASVDKSGRVSAKMKGNAAITAKTDNGKKASCKVTVKTPAVTGIKLSDTVLTMSESAQHQLTYRLLPDHAEEKVSWSSSDSSIVSVGKTGKLTANKAGAATITAKCPNGVLASVKVTVQGHVKSISMAGEDYFVKKGSMQAIDCNASPKQHIEPLKWTSSNPGIAEVDQNGKVTGKAVGTTTITAAAGGFSDSCRLTVTESECVDISKSSVKIWNHTYYQGDERYSYDPRQGIIVFQSCKDRTSHTLSVYTDPDGGEDIHVTLAGINIDGRNNIGAGIDVSGQREDVDVYISLMEGTDNFVSDSGPAFYCNAKKNSNVYIDGKGSLELQTDSSDYRFNCAIRVAWGSLVISSGNIKAKTASAEAGVIYLERSDSRLTILPEAKVTAIGGIKAVDIDEGAEADIAPGSLKYLTD